MDYSRIGLYSEEGDTYLVQIINRQGDNIEIKRLMTADGTLTNYWDPETIFSTQLVSDIPLRDISPKSLYHFASPNVQYKIKASSFVTHGKPLVSACSHGLGSGIYGLYISDEADVYKNKSSSEQIVYSITCQNPFIIQDATHLDSLVTTSMSTTRYVQNIIESLQQKNSTLLDIINIVRSNSVDNLSLLWYIVFLRSINPIGNDKQLLEHILSNYIWEYFTDTSLRDSTTGDIIHELPINYIMRALGYDGIIGNDRKTNSWSRGCVSFNYSFAHILEGFGSRQCLG